MFGGLFVLVFTLVPVEPGASKRGQNFVLAALLISAITLVGCGGGSNSGGGTSGTPSGSYTITVVGASGSVNQTSTLKLTVN
jgi:ABC-type glycerol-3-phosphate transport system substrate-binding protein